MDSTTEATSQLNARSAGANGTASRSATSPDLIRNAKAILSAEFRHYDWDVSSYRMKTLYPPIAVMSRETAAACLEYHGYCRRIAEEIVDGLLSEEPIRGVTTKELVCEEQEEDKAYDPKAVLRECETRGFHKVFYDMQCEVISRALNQANGNRTHAAKSIGMNRSALAMRLTKKSMEKERS